MKNRRHKKLLTLSNDYMAEILLFLTLEELVEQISLVSKHFCMLALIVIDTRIKTKILPHIVARLVIYFPSNIRRLNVLKNACLSATRFLISCSHVKPKFSLSSRFGNKIGKSAAKKCKISIVIMLWIICTTITFKWDLICFNNGGIEYSVGIHHRA